jgi:hypothetical protein
MDEEIGDGRTSSRRLAVSNVLCEAECAVYAQAIPGATATWAVLRWATRARLAGWRQAEAEALVTEWVEAHPECVDPSEALRFASVAFECEVPYRFGCGCGDGDPPEPSVGNLNSLVAAAAVSLLLEWALGANTKRNALHVDLAAFTLERECAQSADECRYCGDPEAGGGGELGSGEVFDIASLSTAETIDQLPAPSYEPTAVAE